MHFLLINGPNLNLLGLRNTAIYGDKSFEEYLPVLRAAFPQHQITYFQSNHEGEILDILHKKGFETDGVIINPGGLAHTSIVLRDAVEAIEAEVVEVHISNIFEREPFRRHSYLTEVTSARFIGHGLEGYRLAVEFLLREKD